MNGEVEFLHPTPMIILIGILALLAAGIAAFARAVRIQMRRAERTRTRATLDDLGGWTRALLLRFSPGACLIADSNDGPGFLQLAVTGREGEWRRVEFGLPDAGWAREHFALAVAVLEEYGVESHVEDDPGNADVPSFLRIT